MSYVTNVIICSLGADQNKKQINRWLYRRRLGGIRDVSDFAGGHKHLETTVLLGAFNYLGDERFIKFLKKIDWEWKTDLFLQCEDDYSFSNTVISEGWRHTEAPEKWVLRYKRS